MADPIYKNSTNLGNGKSDVIINTAGKVIVKVKDRYYTLNYNTDSSDTKDKEPEILTDLIILKTDNEVEEIINSLTKNTVIITAENTMYLYLDDTVYPLSSSSFGGDTLDNLTVEDKLIVNGSIEVKSSNLVQNLNAQYLNGESSTVFVKVNLPQVISKMWTFDEDVFFNKVISDSENRTTLNFNSSSLSIDNITVRNLTVLGNSSDNDSDYIKSQTFIGEGSNIVLVDEYWKEEASWNENWANGGEAIVSLIINSVDNEYLPGHIDANDTNDSYSYYVNRLLDVSTNASFSNLITITEDAFIEDTTPALYKSYYYRPKNVDSTWVDTPYEGYLNAKEGIYNKWFNKDNYASELANFTGMIWIVELSSNPYKIGDKVEYETDFSKIHGLITKSSGKTINMITDGQDCNALYDQNAQEYNTCYNNHAPIVDTSLLSLGGGQSVIGDLTGINNSIFGTLDGYGFSSEGNCYLVNPGIALVSSNRTNYLKLTNKEISFIGLNSNNENFITIDTNGNCDMKRNKMYDINNHKSSCSFGPIVVNEDGSATIGTGTTQITISATGEVKIPSAAVR